MPAQESKYDSTRFDEILKILSGWRVSEPEACPDNSTVCPKVGIPIKFEFAVKTALHFQPLPISCSAKGCAAPLKPDSSMGITRFEHVLYHQ